MCRCCVVKVEGNRIDLSMRASRMGGAEVEVRDPEIISLEDVEEGKVLRGYVKAISDVGVFVR